MDYYIAQAESCELLTVRVKKMIALGWLPLGGMVFGRGMMYQTMTKEAEKETPPVKK